MDIGVLEGQVDLLGGGALLRGVPEVLKVDLDTRSNGISELDLAVKQRRGRPCLGDGDTFAFNRQPEVTICAKATWLSNSENIDSGAERRGYCQNLNGHQAHEPLRLLRILFLLFHFLSARCCGCRVWVCCGGF